jgi:hypothetical protein
MHRPVPTEELDDHELHVRRRAGHVQRLGHRIA